jgi:hypothetical protein
VGHHPADHEAAMVLQTCASKAQRICHHRYGTKYHCCAGDWHAEDVVDEGEESLISAWFEASSQHLIVRTRRFVSTRDVEVVVTAYDRADTASLTPQPSFP